MISITLRQTDTGYAMIADTETPSPPWNNTLYLHTHPTLLDALRHSGRTILWFRGDFTIDSATGTLRDPLPPYTVYTTLGDLHAANHWATHYTDIHSDTPDGRTK